MLPPFFTYFRDTFMYNAYGFFYIAGAGISLSVGLLVLIHNPKNKTNISLFLISLFGSVWQISYAMIFTLSSEAAAYRWLGISYLFGVTFLSPTVFWFVQNWTKYKRFPNATRAAFIIGGFLGLAMFLYPQKLCPFTYTSIGRFNEYGTSPLSWVYLSLVLGHMVFFATWGLYLLFDAWKISSNPKEISQYRIFIIGAIVGYTSINDFFVSLGLNTVLLGHVSFSAYILIMSYAIIRYQFLDMEIGFKRASVIFLIYSVLICLMIPILGPYAVRLIKDSSFHLAFTMLPVFIGTGALLSLGPFIYAGLVRRNFWLKGNMSKGLTHELKSPLGTIQGVTDILKDQSIEGKLEPKQLQSYIEIIEKNTNRLNKFVADLLQIAKSDEGNHAIQKSPTDMAELIRGEIDSLKATAEVKGLKIIQKPTPSITIEIDSEKIRQVLSNLLTNAIKYSSKGTIKVEAVKESSQFSCSVTDQGKGISNEDFPKIFDRFYQGRSSSKGAGLGLAIAKAWVEAHGGKIWAESEGEGKGTKISFNIPTT